MRHLILCREYPPAPYPPGGIGTYVQNIARLLAESGETVHVIGQRWEQADRVREELCSGRLIVHRVIADEPIGLVGDPMPSRPLERDLKALVRSGFPAQWFSWQAGRLAEKLVAEDGIDVIEGQEWEGPLYYLGLRRALGEGPRRRPPCIVHLHSPTEFIFRHNEWDQTRAEYLLMKRLEDYTISSADALVAASHFLAHECESHFGLPSGTITVLRYPMGEAPCLERTQTTWERGTFCYVGRLEPRKGVVEWVQAAVSLARDHPDACFEFIGADLAYAEGVSVRQFVTRQVPRDLRSCFRFHPACRRSELRGFLERARAAVVPSRWDNFPNTCIEAMGSGLPVVASREGGMAEMIEDGRSGWLAPARGRERLVEGLGEALRRALAASASERAAMGREAAAAIRKICDNTRTVQEHLDFRSLVARRGAGRSFLFPSTLPWASRPLSEPTEHRVASAASGKGVAVVLSAGPSGGLLDRCLRSLAAQTRRPVAVVVAVGDPSADLARIATRLRDAGLEALTIRGASAAMAKNAGIEAVCRRGTSPLGFLFLDETVSAMPGCVAAYQATLERCPGVGLVSSWVQRKGGDAGVTVVPCPAFPYQWLWNEVASCLAVRSEALRDAGAFRPGMDGGYENWDLANAVMAGGWIAVTYPAILSEQWIGNRASGRFATPGLARMRRELLSRFPELLARDVPGLLAMVESGMIRGASLSATQGFPDGVPRAALRDRLARVRSALRDPARVTRWVAWTLRRAARRAVTRLVPDMGRRS